jgi:hypothetical protein
MDSKLIRDYCVFHLTYIAKKILVTYGSTLTAESQSLHLKWHTIHNKNMKNQEKERDLHMSFRRSKNTNSSSRNCI